MSVPLPPTTFGFRSRNDWTSRVSRGRSRSCCSSRPRLMAWLSSVMLLAPSAETVIVSFTRADLQSDVQPARSPPHARGCPFVSAFLKFCGDDLDAVRSRPEIGGLVPTLRVGIDVAKRARGLVDDQDRGPADGGSLRIGDRPADGAEEGLRERRSLQPRRMSGSHVSHAHGAHPDCASTAGAKACVRIVFLSPLIVIRRSSVRRATLRDAIAAHLPTSRCTHNKLSECAPLLRRCQRFCDAEC